MAVAVDDEDHRDGVLQEDGKDPVGSRGFIARPELVALALASHHLGCPEGRRVQEEPHDPGNRDSNVDHPILDESQMRDGVDNLEISFEGDQDQTNQGSCEPHKWQETTVDKHADEQTPGVICTTQIANFGRVGDDQKEAGEKIEGDLVYDQLDGRLGSEFLGQKNAEDQAVCQTSDHSHDHHACLEDNQEGFLLHGHHRIVDPCGSSVKVALRRCFR